MATYLDSSYWPVVPFSARDIEACERINAQIHTIREGRGGGGLQTRVTIVTHVIEGMGTVVAVGHITAGQ